jgi:ribokinase
MDLIVPAGRFPAAGETVLGSDLCVVPGGKGANQACAAARLGAVTHMLAQVGNDSFGNLSRRSLEEAGVNTSLVGVSDRSTGAALIVVRPDGENTIVISPGANETLEATLALAKMPAVGPGDFVLLQLEIPLETVEAVAKFSFDCGATVILDPAPVQPLPRTLLECISYLTPNRTECAALLGIPESDLQDLKLVGEAAEKMLAMGPRAVILKLGSEGCWLRGPGVSKHIPGFPVTSVDTTAAGDVFNAAFAVALAEGATSSQAARFGNAAAALSVTKMGAQSSIPDRAQTDNFLTAAALGGA